MFKKKNIILAIGDSFTDPNYRSTIKHLSYKEKGGWPMWPELLHKEIEKETGESYELINLAMSGTGNDWIFNTFIDALAKYNTRIKIVLIGGSQWMRTHVVPSDTRFNPQIDNANFFRPGRPEELKKKFTETYEKAMMQMWYLYSNDIGFKNTIHHNLRIMWTMMHMCKDRKIKLIWNQLLRPLPSAHFWRKRLLKYGSVEGWEINKNLQAWETLKDTLRKTLSDHHISETVLKSPYAKFLVKHKKNFYGFTWSNGMPWDWSSHDDRKEKIICPTIVVDGKKQVDVHPNKLGQEEIAQEMWKVYGNYLVKN